jgi:class 3 adenylate cyclase/ABC-type glycerol-3-phosphate transport system substrate-binding protein
MERKLAAIFSADVQAYSRLMGEDEEATVRTLTAYREVMASLIRQHRGRVVDSPGDNLLAEFASVVDAVACAVAVQRELNTRNRALPDSRQMRFRIGINLGDVLVDGERIYGDGVNIAARLEGLAEGGGLCLSGSAYEQVESKLALTYRYLGAHAVKNIAKPVRVYRVQVEPKAAAPRERRTPWTRGPRSALVVVMLLLVGAVAAALWYMSLPPAPLRILTGLSREELPVFEELVTTFGTRHGLTVTVENVHWRQALSTLKQAPGTIDLITFDINGARFELVHHQLVEDLSGVKGLAPSLMHPVMMKSLDVHEQRFFLPFRPNVRLVFVNRQHLAELAADRLETWADVLDAAKRWYARDGEPRVAVEAGETDAPLLLLELIRSAGGDPCNVLHPQSQAAVQLLRELWPYVSPISARLDWQPASSFLLSESVYVARNWAFALSLLQDAGQERTHEFEVSAGWHWAQDTKPAYLLGGELLALPKQAPHQEVALQLLRFLTSKEAQADLVKKLSWPPMRLDVMGALDEWQQRYQAAITRALRHAEPVPATWWPAMQPLYTRLFTTIVSLSPQADLEGALAGFQALQQDSCEQRPSTASRQ